MTKAEILKLVEEGYRLDRAIKEVGDKVKRLEEIKEVLKARANEEDVAIAAKGCRAEIKFVRQPARRIEAGDLEKVRKIAGAHFETLFCYAPAAGFTDLTGALLGEKAEKLLEVAAPKSGRVSFKAA